MVPVSATLRAGLDSLFDLEGVQGSFLVTGGGSLAARALSPLIDDVTLGEVAGRVVRLAETMAAVGLDPELCVLRFAEHKLYLKVLPGGTLCMVTSGEVSVPALRMAANLVARKVAPELVRLGISARATPLGTATAGESGRTPPPLAPVGRRSSASMPVVPAAAPAAPRMYRGRPMG